MEYSVASTGEGYMASWEYSYAKDKYSVRVTPIGEWRNFSPGYRGHAHHVFYARDELEAFMVGLQIEEQLNNG